MGKVEQNKHNKRTSLLQNAYQLFEDRGFSKTTISDIVKESGLAKGTFYLYFKDKYDLRDQLVAKKSGQVLLYALEAVQNSPKPPENLEAYIFTLTDFILDYLQHNRKLLNFISRNLSWGHFKHAVESSANPEHATEDSEILSRVYQDFLAALERDCYHCEQPELLLFTIIELIGSTGVSCIMYETPCTLEIYLPYLHNAIHHILESYKMK
ncbi:MAG: TetR/AcrR family transcriptional regulator [Eubacteriales bacterium]|nr:TetR/AcrR family transcriptional regulator [Eubacteriales bacterium]